MLGNAAVILAVAGQEDEARQMLAALRAMDPAHSGQTLLRSFYGFADDMTSALRAAARRIGLETG